ncbi:MAG TPA: hypothetical protein VJB57_21345 [Dehalococcoidia bacterium]|nr:hypothetical protein [Dehalococcoidia bacterium]
MTWQDWVFSIGGLFVLVGLVPMIRGEQKPALATSLLTTTLVAIFAATMASMSLWLSALTNAMISIAWGVLALQRYRQDRARRLRYAKNCWTYQLEVRVAHERNTYR